MNSSLKITLAAAIAITVSTGTAHAETRTVYGVCNTSLRSGPGLGIGDMTCREVDDIRGQDAAKSRCVFEAKALNATQSNWKSVCLKREIEIPAWNEIR